ncbi:hypothetical protein [Geodermatophilus sp. CPCC 206100]|uniref:hypothetical protein n=1 Tax=Geodermatophilus sp. CPCC 206100 TaxID=3020054 RepID=UPI003B004955
MTASNPQPGEPGTGDPGPQPSDLKRWLVRVGVGLVVLIAVLTITVSISRCGPDDGPSGGEPQGLAPAVVQVTAGP